MYNTVTDGKLNRIDQITLRLAKLNMSDETAASKREERRLLSELGQLNREIRIMPPAVKPQRTKVNKDGAAVDDHDSSDWTCSDTLAFGLFAIIVICASIVICANI